MPRTRFSVALLAAALASCDVARSVAYSGLTDGCSQCHGDPTRAATAANPQLPAAPPVDTAGNSDTAAIGVGAHQAHLTDGPYRQAIACPECHIVPGRVDSPGHRNGTVEVFPVGAGQLARASGAAPTWNADATCSNVYCHGATLGGGSNQRPVWTKVDGTQAACGTCHGLPPPISQGHPSVTGGLTECVACHPGTVNSDGTIHVAGGMHINGTVDIFGHPAGYGDPTSASFHGSDALMYLEQASSATNCANCHGGDLNGGVGPSCTGCHQSTASALFPNGVQSWKTNCTFCHGTPTEPFYYTTQLTLAAPPDDVTGRLTGTDTAAVVGAHQLHLTGSAVARAFSCATCHAVPANDTSSLNHLVGGTASVTLSGAGQASLPASLGAFTATSNSCAVYCHNPPSAFGNASGSTPTPVWNGSGYACNACHGSGVAGMPSTGQHSNHTFLTCYNCHNATVTNVSTSSIPAIASTAYHVNGLEDVVFGGTYNGNAVSGTFYPNPPAGSYNCTVSCHNSRNW